MHEIKILSSALELKDDDYENKGMILRELAENKEKMREVQNIRYNMQN